MNTHSPKEIAEKLGLIPELVLRTYTNSEMSALSSAIAHDSYKESATLLHRVMIPESWFFRDLAMFHSLARFLKENAPHAQRILSVPCARGEEPYSVALLCAAQNLPTSMVTIEAIDILSDVIDFALNGVYSRNSLRESFPREVLPFVDINEERCVVHEEIRERVHFSCENIFSPQFLSRTPYHCIICRNLLIYLTPEQQQICTARLISLLTKDGRIFTTPAEAPLFKQRGVTVHHEGSVFYVTKHKRKVRSRAIPCCTPRTKKLPTKPFPNTIPSHEISPEGSLKERRIETLHKISALRGEHAFTDALSLIHELHLTEKPHADEFVALAVLAECRGENEVAEIYFRKALYLDPRHEEASLHLALLHHQRGDVARADRLKMNRGLLTAMKEKKV